MGLCNGRNVGAGVVLMEVKLTEGGFTPCSGAASAGNRRKDVCDSAAVFLDDPGACYLRHPWRAARDRRYWEIFASAHGSVRAAFPAAGEGRCPFYGNAQQIMRNHALAIGLTQARHMDWWAFGLSQSEFDHFVATMGSIRQWAEPAPRQVYLQTIS